MNKTSLEEVVKVLEDMKVAIPLPQAAQTKKKRNDALDAAITALNCLEKLNSSDCISRQAAIDAVDNTIPGDWFDMLYPKLEALPSAEPPYNPDEWCHDCKEYDQDRHCCPRFNKMIRRTLEEIKRHRTEND